MGLLAGLITGGLGGGAAAAGQIASDDITEQHKAELAQQLSDQELAKMKAAAAFNMEQQNALREAKVQRIGDAQQGIIDSRVNQQFAPAPAPGGDNIDQGGGWSPDGGAARQAQIDAMRAQLKDDPHTYLQAATQTGDLDPAIVAQTTQRSDASDNMAQWRNAQVQQRAEASQLHNETMAQIAAGHDDTRLMVMSMAKAVAGGAGSKEERLAVTSMIGDMSRNIDERRKELKAIDDQLTIATDPEQKKALAAERAELSQGIKNLQQTHDRMYSYLAPDGADVSALGKGKSAPDAAPPIPKGWDVQEHDAPAAAPAPKAAASAAPKPAPKPVAPPPPPLDPALLQALTHGAAPAPAPGQFQPSPYSLGPGLLTTLK